MFHSKFQCKIMTNSEQVHIQDILSDPASKTEDVLEVESCMFLFNQSLLPVVRFLIDNCDSLIRSALSSERPVIQYRAYSILTSDNSILREVALSRGLIADVFQEFLDAASLDSVVVARIASIMELCLTDLFDEASSQFWFITHLVKHFHVPDVVDLFRNLVQNERICSDFVGWISSLEIDGHLMAEIEQLQKTPVDELNYEYVVGLYDVLHALLKNREMLAHFLSPNRISMLVAPCEGAPAYICDRHFRLLFTILNDSTAPFIAHEIGRLTKLLESESPKLQCDVTWAMKIMVKMLQVAPLQTQGFDINVLVDAAFRILSDFPDHSIGLSEACNCLLFLAEQKDLRDEIIDRFVLVAQYSFECNTSRTLTCWCYHLMTQLVEKIDWTGYDKRDFDSVYSTYVAPMLAATTNPYGGPMPTEFNFFQL